jgi:opacity protein-like surface antigen
MNLAAVVSLSVAVLCAPALHAQNKNLAVLGGISGPGSKVVVSTGRVETSSVGASGQINFAWQVRQTRYGDLFIELPIAGSGQSSSVVGPGVVTSDRAMVFFTPGVRLRVPVQPRIGIYGLIGAGLAVAGSDVVSVGRGPNSVVTISRTNVAGAFNFGGGADFRLTRIVSLRLEGRDFVTTRTITGSGLNHFMIQFGIGFHF